MKYIYLCMNDFSQFLGMKIYKLCLSMASALVSICAMADSNPVQIQKVGTWTNVVSFSINNSEDHLVMIMQDVDGSERAFESNKEGGQWTTPEPIASINDRCTAGTTVGGVFMTADERRIYFHANYEGGVGGYDIYYVDKTVDGWSEPVLDEDISTVADERYPSLICGGETIYFLKHQPVSNAKQEKKDADRQSIFYSERNPKGKWNRALPANNVLNDGYVQDACISSDGRTLYYSNRAERKAESRVMFSYTLLAYQWTLPVIALNDDSSYDYFSPFYAGGNLYCIHSNTKKNIRTGYIICTPCPSNMTPKATVNEKGRVIAMGTERPVTAGVVVIDPTTMGVLGRYNSSSYDGQFDMTNLSNQKYIIDVRSNGYSYASYQVDYSMSEKGQLPAEIALFDTIKLVVNTYDSEVFRPLDAAVKAVRVSDKRAFSSRRVSDGHYEFDLPLGSDYDVYASSKFFADNKFLLRLEGDVVFSKFEREMPMDPQKINYTVRVVDAETKAPLVAKVDMVNLKREEVINVVSSADDVKSVALRLGDSYDMTVSGVQNYSFRKGSVSVAEGGSRDILVELIPLRANAAVRLNNINFETASADIMAESYEELGLVIRLMNENPLLCFEISAHTDNVGAAKYNMSLSEKRAESVVNYLVENGISPERLFPKGYGMTKPLVPNDSEENRAQNRRVEFMLVEVQ